MSIISIIFKPIITFALVASFSMFFMSLFLIVGSWTTKFGRNVPDRSREIKHLGGYIGLSLGGLVTGSISLFAMTLL
ncbi:MAG: hypothetical protein A3B86_02010 [Candidatus Yanofskybacteria bacterium RIFCSPHIGHO2_02_FULL_38_22b]|uniref:DUF350 domain-containing protein n=1 Tax=Candidatus Yanofskybacteria bacterium RIFCSPHIGHO2_02_FULL_38_22b TaxID=1802673 RepID=A0A1F8F3J5_9BACT|nr:MAG: hypothetical protein A2816_00905 [Candidatus Yanofskybacteria bacterium RIFCSPHIGHO2_01_FULL_39_44]OGN07160.1 MAG: hypothetical protein A3B86_02010 [Candidatus Yanofskybacteria bacterium RIFCSPHIGHO2_02_FULL_38_22b]OGN20010.1 MAG: hypothetical protein A2910_00720 [Candidatus Yanofskybacteria bacterium RIFCSPLOWO2_01_FULL_39_28]